MEARRPPADLGRGTLWKLIAPRADDLVRRVASERLGLGEEELPPALLEHERRRIELLCSDDRDDEYEALLRQAVHDAVQLGQDHASFLEGYGVLASHLVTAVDVALSPDAPERPGALRLVLALTHEEAARAMSFFFRAAGTQAWAERAALAQSFQTEVLGSLDEVGAALDAVEGTADAVAEGGARAAATGRDGRGRAARVTERVGGVEAGTRELSASARDLADRVGAASTRARQALEDARGAEARVEALADQGTRIEEVLRLIRSIAEQTRMLALNASIEAARAGSAGRGFAVVASEVKSLAHDTSEATAHIAQRIETLREAATEARAAMSSVSGGVDEISTLVSGMAEVGQSQSEMTAQIAEATAEATEGARALEGCLEDITSFAEETAEASGSVHARAREARQVTSTLGDALRDFLTDIRA
jgi:uncharacterized protein YoxC